MSHQRYRKDRQEKRWVRYVMAILKRYIAFGTHASNIASFANPLNPTYKSWEKVSP